MEDTPTYPKEAPAKCANCGFEWPKDKPMLGVHTCSSVLRAALDEQTKRADRLQVEVERFIELHNGAELNLKTAEEECARLTAELDAAKRGQQYDLNLRVKLIGLLHTYGTGETEERDGENISEMVIRIAAERDAAQAKCAELEKLIQDAPHAPDCNLMTSFKVGVWKCNCFKSRLTPAPPEEKRP